MPPREYRVPGLSSPVDVLVDRWGVPHLYAASTQDVFLAQGFNAARERLFQIDLWRRRGLGLLSEVFGEQYVEHDRAARLFLYRGDMQKEWLAYGAVTEQVVTAFVAGINAFVDLYDEDPRFLPVEFALLGHRPARWDPGDVARIRSHGLYYNLEQEVARALTMRDFGPEVEDLRRVREPACPVTVPEGLDLSLIPDDVLRVYRLATTPPVLGAAPGDVPLRSGEEGSNNWVVGGSRTATGRPLLANDPHRAVGLPSLRYIAHLVAPGLDVVGAGEPALPGISIGHNGHIAFGLTIFPIDQEDLYVYRIHPERPDEYWYSGRWEPMTCVTESVPVAGGAAVPVELRFTRHGPVIHEDPERNTAFAVRATWLEPGMAPYLVSMDYMSAPSCAAFVASMQRWGTPGENQVYADPAGTIGWRPAGRVPIRPNWNGMLPVPGDGRYEWQGFYDAGELPSLENPERDWIATANEMNLPADYPHHERTVTYDWYQRYRHDRICEILHDARGVTVQDCVTLQCDYVSVPARRVVAILAELSADLRSDDRGGDDRGGDDRDGGGPSTHDPDAATGLALLKGWDGDESTSSPSAALYEVWHRRHLRPRLLSDALAGLLPADRVAEALARIQPDEARTADMRTDLALLGDPARRATGSLLLETLADAVRDARALLGPDPEMWAWGQLHHARLDHPAALLPSDPPWTSLGPLPRGGSGNTVGNTAYDHAFRQTTGATFRLVVDVGDWDRSVAMNSPGQSGNPGDPHYSDLFAPWAADENFPLLYSRERIEQHVDHRFRLVPPP